MYRTESEFCRQQAERMYAFAKECVDLDIREQIENMATKCADMAAAKKAAPRAHAFNGSGKRAAADERAEKIVAFEPAAVCLGMGEPWSDEDFIASVQLLSVGIPIGHVAAYLRRTVTEVEEKSGEHLRLSDGRDLIPMTRRPSQNFGYRLAFHGVERG